MARRDREAGRNILPTGSNRHDPAVPQAAARPKILGIPEPLAAIENAGRFGHVSHGSKRPQAGNRTGGFGTITGYDTDFFIRPEPDVGRGAIVASASIDGTGTPAVTKGFGVASITDNGTGDYTLTLTRSAQTASDFTVFASTNQGAGNVRCDLNGVNSVRIRCFAADGTTATDVNELKVLVMRVA